MSRRVDTGDYQPIVPAMFLVQLTSALDEPVDTESPTTAGGRLYKKTGEDEAGLPQFAPNTAAAPVTVVNYTVGLTADSGDVLWCERNMGVIVVLMEAS